MPTPTTVFSLRLPNELKQKCEELASKSNLSLNEWIKRILASIASPSSDEDYQSLMNNIDEYVSHPNITNNSTRIDFIKQACNLLLNSDTCPSCGSLMLPNANYCSECGEEIAWEDENSRYADAFYCEYIKTHPLPQGWRYTIITPSREVPDYGYHIAKYSQARGVYDSMIVIKTLTEEDITHGKELISSYSTIYIPSQSPKSKGNLKETLERVKQELDSEKE